MSKDLDGRLRLWRMQRSGKPAVTADRATIEDVYRTRFTPFVKAMTAIVGSPEYARDAVQEGFARALAARQSYRGDGALEAWIWKIALNAARDAHRHTSRESPLKDPLPLELPQTTDDLTLRDALRQLPKQQRLLVFCTTSPASPTRTSPLSARSAKERSARPYPKPDGRSRRSSPTPTKGHAMNDAKPDNLRLRLQAAIRTTAQPDWLQVQQRAEALTPGPPTGPHHRQARITARRRVATATLSVVVVLIVPAIAVAHLLLSSSPAVAPPIGVPTLPSGWKIVAASPQTIRPAAATNVETLLTSWRYRPTEQGPASVILPGGTMITITLSRDPAHHGREVNLCKTTAKLPLYPQRTPPLTLPTNTSNTMDGAPHVKEFRVLGRYRNSYNFEIRVDIDTRRALSPRWRTANSIIERLRFPVWPARTTC